MPPPPPSVSDDPSRFCTRARPSISSRGRTRTDAVSEADRASLTPPSANPSTAIDEPYARSRGFVTLDQVRITRRERHRPPVVLEGAAVVAGAPVGAGEGAEQVGVLARVLFRVEQDRERFPPGVSPRQCRAKTDARVDV